MTNRATIFPQIRTIFCSTDFFSLLFYFFIYNKSLPKRHSHKITSDMLKPVAFGHRFLKVVTFSF